MEKKPHTYVLLSGQTVSGNVYDLAQLSARFQIWAKAFGLDDEMSLACWFANQPDKHTLYFSGEEEVLKLAKEGFEKIRGVVIPDLSKI